MVGPHRSGATRRWATPSSATSWTHTCGGWRPPDIRGGGPRCSGDPQMLGGGAPQVAARGCGAGDPPSCCVGRRFLKVLPPVPHRPPSAGAIYGSHQGGGGHAKMWGGGVWGGTPQLVGLCPTPKLTGDGGSTRRWSTGGGGSAPRREPRRSFGGWWRWNLWGRREVMGCGVWGEDGGEGPPQSARVPPAPHVWGSSRPPVNLCPPALLRTIGCYGAGVTHRGPMGQR